MAHTEIIKEDVKLPKDFHGCLAFVLYDVFTEEECNEYIRISEDKGYQTALINVAGRQELATDIRNNSRCIWDTYVEVEKIWNRIEPFVPKMWFHRKAVGLNERLRILRYDPGEYFKPHYDGSYRRDNGERSYVTIQIYLNEGFQGGSTTFIGNWSDERVEVVPKTGSVLVFEHDILHEGSSLISGRKYAIRTDVMYSNKVTKHQKEEQSNTADITSENIQTALQNLEDEKCKPS